MRTEDVTLFCSLHEPRPTETVWTFCQKHLDFSLLPSYAEYKGKFDADYMPFYQEICERITDRETRELWVLKCTRAGASENLILNTIRYCVAESPQNILVVSGQQSNLERFFKKRIIDGFKLCPPSQEQFTLGSATEHLIELPAMDIVGTWARNRTAYKQDGFSLVLADEVSLFPEYSTDMLRKRGDNWSFSKIVGISSPDPQSQRSPLEDPIFQEYEAGDRCEWTMPDKDGGAFAFEMGERGKAGLQWDDTAKDAKTGAWNLDAVKASAYYLTPQGERIEEADRLARVRQGRWIPTATTAPQGVHSYHVSAFMLPFRSGGFGEIAAGFLRAKSKGEVALRTYYYETLAKPFYMERAYSNESTLLARRAGYAKGEHFTKAFPTAYQGKTPVLVMTTDVQKGHFWWAIRAWAGGGGDSGLVNWGSCGSWQDLQKIREQHKAVYWFCDAAYNASEVYEQSLRLKFYPLIGSDKIDFLKQHLVDPYEGTSRQGLSPKIKTLTFGVDRYRSILLDFVRGKGSGHWYLPDDISGDFDYLQQVSSTEKVDGVWKSNSANDHLFDCEAQQIAAAEFLRLYNFRTAGAE